MLKKKSHYKRFTRSKIGNISYFTILILAGAFMLLPLIYCIVTAFKPLDELLIFPPRFYVKRPTIKNFLVIPSLLSNLNVPIDRKSVV